MIARIVFCGYRTNSRLPHPSLFAYVVSVIVIMAMVPVAVRRDHRPVDPSIIVVIVIAMANDVTHQQHPCQVSHIAQCASCEL